MLKNFVSSDEVERRRQERKANWERTRGPNDPLGLQYKSTKYFFIYYIAYSHNNILNSEPPEEPAEKRSLFEQLQEQKEKSDKEWEEAHSLSSFILIIFRLIKKIGF